MGFRVWGEAKNSGMTVSRIPRRFGRLPVQILKQGQNEENSSQDILEEAELPGVLLGRSKMDLSQYLRWRKDGGSEYGAETQREMALDDGQESLSPVLREPMLAKNPVSAVPVGNVSA